MSRREFSRTKTLPVPAPILTTKLYIPPLRPKVVLRPQLVQRLNAGLHRKLTLISAPAGFGKTTLVSEWVANCGRPTAWLSLDEGDNDPARFLSHLIAALQTRAPKLGESALNALQTPQPPSVESILTGLLNEIAAIPENFILGLDDYHVIDAKPVEAALAFLIEGLPPQMHLVIATREDPDLHLARLRARDQLTELRANDLRFTPSEAAEFLNQVMGLRLNAEDVAALEARTEGWIAGLQLAAISMQSHKEAAGFIKTFTGSHHFVMDYLVEEVLHQQTAEVQNFLLRTAILNRMCGPLCEAVLGDAASNGQATLAFLEQANLFIIPLDNERRWYRYHHLFAELLRQRLQHSLAASAEGVTELHTRASQWFEDNGLELEAFEHAALANDIERAERLIDGKGIPMHFRGAVITILNWLGALPKAVLDTKPHLYLRFAQLLLINGHTTGVAEKLDAAEAAQPFPAGSESARDFLGRIAAARATLALTRYDAEAMLAESHRALENLNPNALAIRGNAHWTLGYAYVLKGDRAAGRHAFLEAMALTQKANAIFTGILATTGLATVQEVDNELHAAAETYRRILHVAGDQPLQFISASHLGLAQILYEWNDLEAAQHHGEKSLHLAQQYDRVIDRFILSELFLARLKVARGEVAEAAAMLAQTQQNARQKHFMHRLPEVAAAQVRVFLLLGNVAGAAQLEQTYPLPLSQARVYLAQGNSAAALATLEAFRQQVEAKNWPDERLRAIVLQALAFHAHGEKGTARQVLSEALTLAEPGGFIRSFVDEGRPMAELLTHLKSTSGVLSDYVAKLLAAFERPSAPARPELIEPLSQRELEVLQLIAQGYSNEEIGERLFLALNTVKGHNRKIFEKLQVERRTEAVARARELGLL